MKKIKTIGEYTYGRLATCEPWRKKEKVKGIDLKPGILCAVLSIIGFLTVMASLFYPSMGASHGDTLLAVFEFLAAGILAWLSFVVIGIIRKRRLFL
jgi:hypothetical protein